MILKVFLNIVITYSRTLMARSPSKIALTYSIPPFRGAILTICICILFIWLNIQNAWFKLWLFHLGVVRQTNLIDTAILFDFEASLCLWLIILYKFFTRLISFLLVLWRHKGFILLIYRLVLFDITLLSSIIIP